MHYQDAGAVFGVVPKLMWERLGIALNDQHQMALGLNSLLVESQGKRIIVDTGVGEKERPLRQTERPRGSLLDDLARAGLRPEDIDIVINTHLHADHCGWNTRRDDAGAYVPAFPRARYLVQRAEWEAAIAPNERTRTTYLEENLRPVEAAGQLELLDGETAVTDEVTIVPALGHSAGHACVVLASGRETAICTGDLVQHHAQLERTAWVSAFDIYPLEMMDTKRRLLQNAIDGQHLIVSVHADYPGLGHLVERDGKRKWTLVEPNA